MMPTTYRLTPRARLIAIAIGIVCCVSVVLLPLGVLAFVVAYRTHITLTDMGITIGWMGSRTLRWSEIIALRWETEAHDLFASLARIGGPPLLYELSPASGKQGGRISVRWHENSDDLVRELQARARTRIV